MVTKKVVNVKKDNTLLTIVAVILVGFLLFNYSNLTGQAAKGQVYEKQLHNYMREGNVEFYGGYEIELMGVTSNGDVVVSVDSSSPQIAWWSGCELDDQGTWIRSGISGGLNVRVCASSYDRQEADLDFRL